MYGERSDLEASETACAVWYNEHDRFAAAWLRALGEAGEIPAGPVDERSIVDLGPEDVGDATQAHFFAGIGGWPLALRLAGWPAERPVWTGSCPCQPFSAAGKGRAAADERHLWPAWHRLLAERRPPAVFGEQVASAAGRAWLDAVLADLEDLGYAVGAADLCAAGTGAPHARQRLFWCAVADADRHGDRSSRPGPSKGTPGRDEGADGQRQRFWADARAGGSALVGVGLADANRVHGRAAQGRTDAGADGRDVARGGGADGRDVGHTHVLGPQGRGVGGKRPDERAAGAAGVAGGDVVDATSRGEGAAEQPGRLRGDELAGEAHGLTRGFWHPADWLPCTDGVVRPVEPGTFPLAHGLPGRVGRLRGYGNAIVPQVAAVFVRAVMGWLD